MSQLNKSNAIYFTAAASYMGPPLGLRFRVIPGSYFKRQPCMRLPPFQVMLPQLRRGRGTIRLRQRMKHLSCRGPL